MKKVIFSIREKHERITIRRKRRRRHSFAVCDECVTQDELLTVEEAARLSGTNREDIRENLKILRRENNEH